MFVIHTAWSLLERLCISGLLQSRTTIKGSWIYCSKSFAHYINHTAKMWPISVPWISLIWEMRKKPCMEIAWSLCEACVKPAWSLREVHELIASYGLSQYNASRPSRITSQFHVPGLNCLSCVFLQSDCEWSSPRAASRQDGPYPQH